MTCHCLHNFLCLTCIYSTVLLRLLLPHLADILSQLALKEFCLCSQAHPPPLPASGSSGARAHIPSPFSAVQPSDSPGPSGPGDSDMSGRLSGRASSRALSQTAPSLPKPMTPAMIAEATAAKQRSRQSKNWLLTVLRGSAKILQGLAQGKFWKACSNESQL